uniref:Uncharacterized protein n=1 Tax=Micrurus lemniscatus lemniscatus TaxID=129467 RepID=A0A2D4IQC9_MICLE
MLQPSHRQNCHFLSPPFLTCITRATVPTPSTFTEKPLIGQNTRTLLYTFCEPITTPHQPFQGPGLAMISHLPYVLTGEKNVHTLTPQTRFSLDRGKLAQ